MKKRRKKSEVREDGKPRDLGPTVSLGVTVYVQEDVGQPLFIRDGLGEERTDVVRGGKLFCTASYVLVLGKLVLMNGGL